MATWSFVLAPGGDITSLVDVNSIVKTERLFTELRSNVNKVEFRALFNSSLFATLLSNDTVEVTITKDSVAYFAGVISPNHRTPIRDGQKYISMIAEDYTLSRLGKTITAPVAYAGYAVCTPSATSTSLVHAIATAAGVTLAASLPTISTTVPYVVALPDDKTTWGALLEGILFEFGYVYLFQADGTLAILPSVNTGTISTTGTLTTAAGSANIRGDLDIEKSPEKYDDIRIRYDLVELKTGIVLFQDTTGGSETSPCSIPLAAAGDADGKDYYPLTSKIGEVFSAWNNPGGFKVWVVTSAALDVTAETGIVADRSLTNYYRKCSFSYKNTAGAEKRITKLRITGNAYVVASQNVARTSIASAKKLLEITANYIFNAAAAESLAEKIAQYYKYSDLKYRAKSTDVFTLGQYVAVVDTVYSGLSTDCRVVGRVFRENASGVIEYELEGVDDFAAVIVGAEGASVPLPDSIFGKAVTQYWEQRYKLSATAPSAPTLADPADWFVAIPSGTDPIWVTGVLKNADGTLAGTWADPRQINTTTQWYAYHDNAPSSAPATPTGEGTSGGWHANETSASVWVSVKTSVLRGDAGTWSTPAVRPGITLLPTYSPKYLGPGRLSATGTAAFRKDTINADGSVTTGSNITPNPGDWMYNYDTSLVATLSVFRWSGTAWETGTVTWEHWIAATEDIGRYIKGGTTEAIRTARTPASWTFFDTLFASEAFIDRLAARLIRSANYNAGVAGMSIDLNSAIMQAENGKWKIDGTTGKIYAYDLVAYGIDLEIVNGGSYSAIPAEALYGVDGLLDGGTYVAGSYEPDGTIDGGYFMGG